MAVRSSARNVVLLDAVAISSVGAQQETSFFPPHNLNPRFQLKVENFTGTAAKIRIEHSEVSGQWSELYSEFLVEANGVYQARAEDLLTRFPFTRVRAYVVELSGGATLTATLVGVCDRC